MLRRSGCLAAIATLATAAHAADGVRPEATTVIDEGRPLLAKLVGRWTLSGTIRGKPTVHAVRAVPSLQGNYVRIEERSRERDPQGRPVYEATIFVGWNSRTGTYVCTWLDSTEVETGDVSCVAHPAANAMPFVFRDGSGNAVIATTFTYHPSSDRWEWAIDNVQGDRRTTFARLTLSRTAK